ncbi:MULTISPECIES: hypothetical protein [Bacteroides]|jgi:hypothetical protein bacD2_13218|uniref:hypothetical protein n=1 Tax=Bacteroides TaxID=816 RepID=UPI00164B8D6F|nr:MULTISPECIES: hypothetical protein [Bacteroides]MBC5587006.1 hypothetical protein [Bacteroides sp. NSJ-39]
MKNILYILLASMLFLWTACDKEDGWDVDMGNNPLEGTWIREGVSQKVLVTFNADFTSCITTYDIETGEVENIYQQGRYRIEGDSLLIYQNGYKNLYKMSEDANKVIIIYGYGNDNPKAETKYTYSRYIEMPEDKELQIADLEIAQEVLGDLKTGQAVAVSLNNWEDKELVGVHLRKELTAEDFEMTGCTLNEGTLAFTVPEDTPVGSYSLVLVYTVDGKKKEVEFDALPCLVQGMIPPADLNVFVFRNQMLGANQNPDVGCMLTVDESQLDIQTACCMVENSALTSEENQKRRAEIDIIGMSYSGPAFALANSKKIGNNLKSFHCGGKALQNADTAEKQEQYYKGYLSIDTKFVVLQEDSYMEAPIIELVRNNGLREISEFATPELFNGNIRIDKNNVQSVNEGGNVNPNLFGVGSVVAFQSSKNGKIGLIHILKINLDTSSAAKEATIVFDLYYQK